MNQFKHLLSAASFFLLYSCSEEQATVIVDIYYKEALPVMESPSLQDDLVHVAKVFESDGYYIVPSITVHRADLANQSQFFNVTMPNSAALPTSKEEFSQAFSAMHSNYIRPPFLELETDTISVMPLEPPYICISLNDTLPINKDPGVTYYTIKDWRLDAETIVAANKSRRLHILVTNGFSEFAVGDDINFQDNNGFEPIDARASIIEPEPDPDTVLKFDDGLDRKKKIKDASLELAITPSNFDDAVGIYRAVESICWGDQPIGTDVRIEFVSVQGRKLKYEGSASEKCFELVNLGLKTTTDVFEATVFLTDDKGKVLDRATVNSQFQISCK